VFDANTADLTGYVFTMTVYLFVGIASFLVVKYHYGTRVFRRAYTALGIAYLSIFVAEVIYFIYDFYLQIDPYPSLADPFYFALYPFTIIHLILNIRFFKPKITHVEKIPYILLSMGIITTYVILSLQELGEPNFDFWYGLVFVIGAAITLSFAIFAARIFRKGFLGITWLLLVLGITALTIGDVWYYYLEIFGEFTIVHAVNLFWYTGSLIMVYALFNHRK